MSAVSAQAIAPQMGAPVDVDARITEPTAAAAVSRDPVSKDSADPVLSAYFREVSRVALLSRDGEILLFTRPCEARAAASRLLDPLDNLLTTAQTKSLRASALRYEEMCGTWQDIAGGA